VGPRNIDPRPLTRDRQRIKSREWTTLPTTASFAHRIELLKKDFDVLKADISAKLDQMANDAAKRDKDNQRWIMGLVLACTAIVVGAVALL